MSVISHLFGRRGGGKEPWVKDSIYRFVASNIDAATGRLRSENLNLPDEPSAQGGRAIRWAPGALDGVGSHHIGKSEAKSTARRVAKLIEGIARDGNRKSLNALYGILKDDAIVGLIDDVIQILADRQVEVGPHLQELAVRLATESACRGPVKFGIALLGVLRLREHEDVVLTLGKHEEFTLFASVALCNMLDDASTALWNLARHVDGWGRIQAVERLVPTTNPEVQRWLRTEGFRNSIMYEYLAHTCAVHGRLREALCAESVPPSELLAAGQIVSALITGNGAPAAGIDDYEDAAEVCRTYLVHVLSQPHDLRHFLTAQLVLTYLREDKREPGDRLRNGFSDAARNSVVHLANQLVNDPAWQVLVTKQLGSEDEQSVYDASRAAEHLSLDTFEVHWNRLVSNPYDSGRWFYVMQRANADRIEQIVHLAESRLALDKIASGPANEMGFGPEYQHHSCLDFVLQDLKAHPGKGWRLVEAGLNSPVVRNRHMALNALEGWARDAWPNGAAAALQSASEREPDSNLQERISRMLNKLTTGS
jgi:hypothetical protein